MEEPFGDVLRRSRRAASLSQQELAERAGLTVNGVSQLERGVRTRPYPYTIRALADALELTGTARERFLAAAPPHANLAGRSTAAALPSPVLVGRDADLADLLALLERNRLVTLTGPGGVGKTSLALAAAARVAEGTTRRATVVPLADVEDVEVALLTIARAVGIHDGGVGDVRDRLRTALADTRRLLVLDNLEQLPDLTGEVAALLSDLPSLGVLATSRGPLRSRLEVEVPVAPLLPDDAVHLLVDRATVTPAPIDPERVDGTTAEALRVISQRVDGLPLLLELAAAWLRVVSPAELAERLSDALPLLVGGPVELPPRHRSLRATIAWSERLLEEGDREVFQALATLPSSWDLATAAAVAARPETETLRTLALLVERSLVVRDGEGVDGRTRYRMLETVRAYGREQLAARDGDATRARLAAFVVGLVEQAGPGSHGPEQAVWLDRVEERLPDVRASLRWALDAGHADVAARVYEPLVWPWYLRHPTEGTRWGRALLAVGDRLDPALLARVAGSYALAVYARGDRDESLEAARRAADLAADSADREALARAFAVLANAAANLGDRTLVSDVARRTDDLADDVPFAAVARASVRLAQVRLELTAGSFEAARELLSRADHDVTRAGTPWLRSLWLNVVVGASLLAGDDTDQLPRLERSLDISTELGDAPATLYAVTLLAVSQAAHGAAEDAARTLGAAEAHALRTGQRIADPGTEQLVAGLRHRLRVELGQDRLQAALTSGSRWTPHEALVAWRGAAAASGATTAG